MRKSNSKNVKLMVAGIVLVMAGFIALMSTSATTRKADNYMNRARLEAQPQMVAGKTFDQVVSTEKRKAEKLYKTANTDKALGIFFIGAGAVVVVVEKKKMKKANA